MGPEEFSHFPAEMAFLRIARTRCLAVLLGEIEIGIRAAIADHTHQFVIGVKSAIHLFDQRSGPHIADDDAAFSVVYGACGGNGGDWSSP